MTVICASFHCVLIGSVEQAEQVNNHMRAIKQKQEHESQLSQLTSALLEAKKELANARCQPIPPASAANNNEVNENQQQLGKQCSLRMCVSNSSHPVADHSIDPQTQALILPSARVFFPGTTTVYCSACSMVRKNSVSDFAVLQRQNWPNIALTTRS